MAVTVAWPLAPISVALSSDAAGRAPFLRQGAGCQALRKARAREPRGKAVAGSNHREGGDKGSEMEKQPCKVPPLSAERIKGPLGSDNSNVYGCGQMLQLLQMAVEDCQAAVEKEYEEIAHKKMVNSNQKGWSKIAWQIF